MEIYWLAYQWEKEVFGLMVSVVFVEFITRVVLCAKNVEKILKARKKLGKAPRKAHNLRNLKKLNYPEKLRPNFPNPHCKIFQIIQH
jgi:hypothetical protein